MSTITKDLGAVTAYAYAVEQGYTGTEEEFAELMADYAAVEQRAAQSATAASAAAEAAQQAGTSAGGSATGAASSAQAAAQSAAEAAESARTLTIDPTLTQSGQAADAKVVGDKIEGVKSAIDFIDNEVNNNIGTLPYYMFQLGAWMITSNRLYIDSSYSTIMCTKEIICLPYEITITPKNGYRVSVAYTNGDDVVTVNFGWMTTAFTIPAYQYFALSLRRVIDSGAIVLGDFIKNYEITPSFIRVMYGKAFRKELYVDSENGNDSTGDGTYKKPYSTIMKAITEGAEIVYIEPGTYTETITISGRKIHLCTNWKYFVSGSVTDRPKAIIDGASAITTALTIQECSEVILEDIIVQSCTNNGALINKCQNVKIQNCEFNSNGLNGIVINYSNGIIRDCRANNNGNDGFNMNYFGDTQFYNCSGHDNVDDGISHHQGTTGSINGGEWYNNGKGGVASPAHGSQIDIYNVYCHDNAYGIYANADSDTVARTFRVWNSVLVNNSQYGITSKRNTAIMYGCKVSGNTVGQSTAPSGGHIITL